MKINDYFLVENFSKIVFHSAYLIVIYIFGVAELVFIIIQELFGEVQGA